ncbi:transposase [Pediococcus pentosaceus]|uniref:transposase n=1 Tax=Pediococcus pentosaceus TaxID=1255 RepID=UPI0020734C7F|nr:transposase [Pediococcus pentosaceus]MCQ0028956.1 transposase [Pediococcus pentosaceus]
MSKRKRYSVEFKKMIVQLHESGTSVTDLTSEYGIASATIYKWNDLYKKDNDIGVGCKLIPETTFKRGYNE